MPKDVFGSGIRLDDDWDFVVDGTGDIDYEEGLSELEKDLAFITAQELEEFVGEPLSQTVNAKIRLRVKTVFAEDERISSINSLNVEHEQPSEIEVNTTITADDGTTYSFVIPVGE